MSEKKEVDEIDLLIKTVKLQGIKVDEKSFILGYYSALSYSQRLVEEELFEVKCIEDESDVARYIKTTEIKRNIITDLINKARRRLRKVMIKSGDRIPYWLSEERDL
jgi:hypothetical protein